MGEVRQGARVESVPRAHGSTSVNFLQGKYDTETLYTFFTMGGPAQNMCIEKWILCMYIYVYLYVLID